MSPPVDQAGALAVAVYEMRRLLAGHLGSNAAGQDEARAAAYLVYALHDQAQAVLAGKSFDTDAALQTMARVDEAFG